MSSAHVEVESKYDVDEDAVLPALDDLEGVSTSTLPVEHELEASYFDTADFALAAARITLRRRTGGDDEGWHIKLPLEQGRQELHFPLGRATRNVPKAVRSIVTGVVRDRPLDLVATLRTRRTVRGLLDQTGLRLAEVCDDRVTATRPSDDTAMSWREWEVELVEGGRSVLKRVDRLLREHGAVTSASVSKLGRVLEGAVPVREARRAQHSSRAETLVADRLTELVDTLTGLDPLVRADLPHAVHSMRVSVRRLAGALATYRPLLDREVSEPLRLDLKWLAGVLGDARDAEVLLERLTDALADERSPLRNRVEHTVRADRRAAHLSAVQDMESRRYLTLLDSLAELGAEPPWSPDRPARKATNVLVARVDHEWKRVAGRMSLAESTTVEERAEALHDARRAAKRLRYAVEPMVPVFGKPAKKTLAAAHALHTVLGEHHDSIVAGQRLAELAADLTPMDAFHLGLQSARQHDDADRAEVEVARVWKQLKKRRPRRWGA